MDKKCRECGRYEYFCDGVVKNRLESVFACIRDLHDIAEFLTGEEKHKVIVTSEEQAGQTVIHADVAELETVKQENASLKQIIHNLALDNVELEAHIDDRTIALTRARIQAAKYLTEREILQRKTISGDREKIADERIAALMNENNQLKKQVSLLKANINNTGYDKDKVMTVLVDIAQAHIDGRLVVKPEHFKELRKAATASN